uniref:PSI domain-containing protein n=1 Tax=Neolamprologus brichardi TaxID=32507 RepID=A0A3Q4HT45_NEOBR
MYSPSAFVFVLISCGIITVTAQTPTPAPGESKFVLLVCVSAALFFLESPCALKSNTTCDECLQNVTCLWCITTKKCIEYPVKSILPSNSVCPLNDARWGLCWRKTGKHTCYYYYLMRDVCMEEIYFFTLSRKASQL